MAIKFVLLVNKQGQTRVSQYYEYKDVQQRATDEAEIIRKCLTRNETQVHFFILFPALHSEKLNHVRYVFGQCSVMEYQNFKLVYRRYASLYFIMGIENSEVPFDAFYCYLFEEHQRSSLLFFPNPFVERACCS